MLTLSSRVVIYINSWFQVAALRFFSTMSLVVIRSLQSKSDVVTDMPQTSLTMRTIQCNISSYELIRLIQYAVIVLKARTYSNL